MKYTVENNKRGGLRNIIQKRDWDANGSDVQQYLTLKHILDPSLSGFFKNKKISREVKDSVSI